MTENKKPVLIASVICTIIFLVLASISLSNDFTGDTGDSLMHYLYSHYSFKHPGLFLNHWAKPLFVLISSPFSQFGFQGIKIFNCLMASLTCFFTLVTAQKLKLKYWWLVVIIMFFSPLYFRLIFSGLTEYMFGLALILSIYLAISKRIIPAIIIVSFLPFIRSEGLIIEGVFLVYLLFKARYKLLPLLLTGHLIYSVIGYFYYRDFLWVFTKIPYESQLSNHGHGGIFDFVHILNYVIEKPNFILLGIGFISCIACFFMRKFSSESLRNKNPTAEEIILVYGGFAVFFMAHTIFWWKGLFNSGGFLMPRVMNAVIPLIALIAIGGLSFIVEFIKKPLFAKLLVGLVAITIIAYPFKPKTQGLVFNRNLFILPENDLVKNKVVPFIKDSIPGYGEYKLYYCQPYISVCLSNDIFDSLHYGNPIHLFSDRLPAKTLIIWDDWFSPKEAGISLEALTSKKEFVLIKSFECTEGNRQIKFVVFKKI